MFAFLRGTVAFKGPDHVALDVGGAGYLVYVPGTTASKLRPQTDVTLLTHCHIREDAFVIFGFQKAEELALFRNFLGITKVGPKVALAILSTLSVAQIGQAVFDNDVKAFARVPGVGTKMAQRIVLEMKAKLGQDAELEAILGGGNGSGATAPTPETDDVIAALCAQGCSLNEARKAAEMARKQVGEGASDEDVLRAAFRTLARR